MDDISLYLASNLDIPVSDTKFRENGKRVLTHFSFSHPDYASPWAFERALTEKWGMEIPNWVFGNHFFGAGNYDPAWINEDSLKARLQIVPECSLLICDLEGPAEVDIGMGWIPYCYNKDDKLPEFREDIAEKRLRVGEIVSAERPDLSWGWWSHIPCTKGNWWYKYREEWEEINDKLVPMAEQVNFLTPHHYMYCGPEWEGIVIEWWEQKIQLRYLSQLIEAARVYVKPVYPFLSVWWYDKWKTIGEDQRVPYHRFVPYLYLAYYLGDGVALWHQKDYGCEEYPEWNEDADWWQALRGLLVMEGFPPLENIVEELE